MRPRTIGIWTLAALSLVAAGRGGALPAPPCDSVTTGAQSPAKLVAVLAHAYRTLDLELYSTLFTNPDAHGVPFHFVLERPTESGETEWGYEEEMRVHRRMFRPETLGPDDEPLARDLWVRSIDVELVPLTRFDERFDFYRSEADPTAELDRKRWRATDAVYATDVTWHLLCGMRMHIAGQARFVVVEDLWKQGGDAARFLLYRWEDLGRGQTGVAQTEP